jgi:hypothetical protein
MSHLKVRPVSDIEHSQSPVGTSAQKTVLSPRGDVVNSRWVMPLYSVHRLYGEDMMRKSGNKREKEWVIENTE